MSGTSVSHVLTMKVTTNMLNFLQTILFLSLGSSILISTCCAKELQLECKHRVSTIYGGLSRILDVCHVKKFNITEDDTQLVFMDTNSKTYTGVRIESSKFTVFPKEILKIFPQTVALAVAFSDMTKIEDNSFRNASQLLDLDLGYNKITKINELTFAGADNLIDLRLNVNKITEVSPRALNCVPKLEILELGQNEISTLHMETFAKLKNLKTLSLNSNPLSHIAPQLFIHNERLSVLRLGVMEFDELELELSTNQMEKLAIYGTHSHLKKLTLR